MWMTKRIFVREGFEQDECWWLHKYSLWPGWLGTFIDIINRLTSSLILWLFVLSLLHHSCLAAALPFMEILQLICCRSHRHSWMFLQLITSPLSLLGLWWKQVEILDKFTSPGFLVSGGTQSWLFFSEDSHAVCLGSVSASLTLSPSLFFPLWLIWWMDEYQLLFLHRLLVHLLWVMNSWSRRASCNLSTQDKDSGDNRLSHHTPSPFPKNVHVCTHSTHVWSCVDRCDD